MKTADGVDRTTPPRAQAMCDLIGCSTGVIFDASERDWWGFLEGRGFATDSGIEPIDPSDYNAPSGYDPLASSSAPRQ